MIRRLALCVALLGCASRSRRDLAAPGTPASVDIARARAVDAPSVAWSPWSRETFASARVEGRFVVLDVAAAWCHWCHVMDETTWRDPAVVGLVGARFVAVRVDVDARPDLASRYAAWGWPATVILSPDGRELAKLRGYVDPARMRALLADVDALRPGDAVTDDAPAERAVPDGLRDAYAQWVAARMDRLYDPVEGSWGDWQKMAVGHDLAADARRARAGDVTARARVAQTVRAQRALFDPVWGGVYQYSARGDWTAPHFEKLLTIQCAVIEGCVEAADAPGALDDARRVAGYVTTFLRDGDGRFLPAQDADVYGHAREHPFVDGHVYYALDDAARRRLGAPRVDPHPYARESGLAARALTALWSATREDRWLRDARGALDATLRGCVSPDGAVRREPGDEGPRHLADAAALGHALAAMSEALGAREGTAYRDAARRVAAAMVRDLRDDATGTFWAHTAMPGATGVFAARERPTDGNVMAARFLLALARAEGASGGAWRGLATATLAVMLGDARVAAQGRFVGELLLALDEAGLWRPAPRVTRRTWTDAQSDVAMALDGGAVTVSVAARAGFHVNAQYPWTLDVTTPDGATTTLRRDAAALSDDRARFAATVDVPLAARVTLRYALCGADRCEPQERVAVLGRDGPTPRP